MYITPPWGWLATLTRSRQYIAACRVVMVGESPSEVFGVENLLRCPPPLLAFGFFILTHEFFHVNEADELVDVFCLEVVLFVNFVLNYVLNG